MTIWNERFKSHEIHDNISLVQEKLKGLEHDEFTSDDTPEKIDRLSLILDYIKTILNNTNPELIPFKTLNSINTPIKNINGDLTNFINSKDENIFNTSNDRAENAILALNQIPKIEKVIEIEALEDSVISFNKSTRDKLNEIEHSKNQFLSEIDEKMLKLSNQIKDSNNSLNKLKNEIEGQKGRLDTAIAEYQSQFSQSQEDHRQKFNNALTKQTSELNKLQENNKNQISNLILEYKEKIDTNIEEVKNKTEALHAEQTEKAKDQIEFLNNKLEEAKKIVGVIGKVSVTGEYNKNASTERKTADQFRLIALGFMAAAVLAVAYIVFSIDAKDFKWELILFRIGIALILLIPAFYSAKESDKHRQREVRYRKMELELASIDPYLELLPKEKKETLKSDLTKSFFGQPEIVAESEEIIKPNKLLDIIKMAMQNLTKK